MLAFNKCVGGSIRTLFILLTATVLLTIKTKSLLLFYVFFEFSLVPITCIVYLYGYQPEKIHAAIALLLYTVVSRLPLLLFIVYCELSFKISVALTIPITLRFIVKSPMFILHT